VRTYILMLPVLLISFIGCAHRAPTKRMLDHRAGYDVDIADAENLLPDSNRKVVKSAVAWIHPNRLPSGDQFWGAWISIKIDEPGWNLYVPRYEKDGMFLEKE
jgi:hypothetical protein